jgi:hypothetical protein
MGGQTGDVNELNWRIMYDLMAVGNNDCGGQDTCLTYVQ